VERKKLIELFHRLSHPFPAVMIDRILEMEKGKRVRAVKNVTVNEFFLPGHFPGMPIVPGVMTLEGMLQSALILVNETYSWGKVTGALEKVARLKFKRPVVPGDRIEFQVQLTAQEDHFLKFKGKALVGGETAAEADFVLKISIREVGFDL
jgi:3-hydroxyacyl-[acyl-carrier-protein] dehydratase